ncbi:MAG: peptide-methionine (S)-S-oxide reductase MsrA [Candidatus Thorarchaeota archaeon]|jgi:peptide-methionine (S)-S-oxide reductase
MDIATFGAGCFWCTEAVFQQLKGVKSVVSGYSGGHIISPTYQQVVSGTSGHAEVTQITFDREIISFEELLEVFFTIHDPTTLNHQGNDVGTQYRSAIFYHDEGQKLSAEKVRDELEANGTWKNPIVTEITPFEKFYEAEPYHQDYYRNNPNQGYCQYIIKPKLDKIEKVFKLKLL